MNIATDNQFGELDVTPFLKWAGGKRWLITSNQMPRLPKFARYIEPFLGSGAVFFNIKPKTAILSDVNSEIIQLYQAIQSSPQEMHRLMVAHQSKHSKSYYYQIRETEFDNPLERASRTLYLNRTCWNGLYRVNLSGKFNVPIGTKDKVLLESDDFEKTAVLLSNAQIKCADFEASIDRAQEGDLLFVDPPYTVQHNMNGFIKYNEKIFSWEDQVRLRDCLYRAIDRRASVVLTNADHHSIHDLYQDRFQLKRLHRHSVLAGKASKRGLTSEVLLLANL